MVARHLIRQLQLMTVKRGAREVVEAAEDVLVKVEEVLGLVPGCSCSQIDPLPFLSLMGLTVLLAWLGFFKGFTT